MIIRYEWLPILQGSKIKKRFGELGHVKCLHSFVDEDTLLNALFEILTSAWQIAQNNSLIITKLLKPNLLHPYKIHPTQDLFKDDPDRQIAFCGEMMRKFDQHEFLLTYVLL